MNGNGELTETENVIFLRKHGVLTEFLQMNLILCYGNGYGNGYGTLEIRHKFAEVVNECSYCLRDYFTFSPPRPPIVVVGRLRIKAIGPPFAYKLGW